MVGSVFGANVGDYLSDALRLGHLSGLPVLAVLLALILGGLILIVGTRRRNPEA